MPYEPSPASRAFRAAVRGWADHVNQPKVLKRYLDAGTLARQRITDRFEKEEARLILEIIRETLERARKR